MTTKKKIIIASAIFGVLVIGGIIFYRLRKKNKSSETKEIQEIEKEVVEEVLKETKLAEVDVKQLEQNPKILKLKGEFAKVYDIFKNEQFELCPTDTQKIINCKTKSAFSDGAVQGSWILLQKRFRNARKEFRDSLSTSENDLKVYGEKLISKLDQEMNRIFKPQYFSENTKWYSEYIKKGGIPLPS